MATHSDINNVQLQMTNCSSPMKNYLISEAIGDIAGSAYEGKAHRIKDYDKVKMFSSRARFTDDIGEHLRRQCIGYRNDHFGGIKCNDEQNRGLRPRLWYAGKCNHDGEGQCPVRQPGHGLYRAWANIAYHWCDGEPDV